MASEGLERCIPDDMFTFIGSSGAQKRLLIEFKKYNLSITMDSMINGSGDEGVLNAEWELLTNKVAHEIKYCEIRITDTIFTVRAVLAAYLFYIFRSDNQVAKRIVTEAFELVRKSPEEIDSTRCTGGVQSSTELIYLCHEIKLLEAGKSDPIIAQKFLEYGNIDWCKNGDDFHGAYLLTLEKVTFKHASDLVNDKKKMKKLLHQLQILYDIEIYHYDFKVLNLCTDAFGNAGLPDYRDARFCEKGTIYKGDIGKLNITDKVLSPRK